MIKKGFFKRKIYLKNNKKTEKSELKIGNMYKKCVEICADYSNIKLAIDL